MKAKYHTKCQICKEETKVGEEILSHPNTDGSIHWCGNPNCPKSEDVER